MRMLPKMALAALLLGSTLAAPAFAASTGCVPGAKLAQGEGGPKSGGQLAQGEGGPKSGGQLAQGEGGPKSGGQLAQGEGGPKSGGQLAPGRGRTLRVTRPGRFAQQLWNLERLQAS